MSKMIVYSDKDILDPKNYSREAGVEVSVIDYIDDTFKLPESSKEIKDMYKKIAINPENFKGDKMFVYILEDTNDEKGKEKFIAVDDANWGSHLYFADDYIKDSYYPEYYVADEYPDVAEIVEEYREGKKSITDVLEAEDEKYQEDSFGRLYGLYKITDSKVYDLKS